MKEEARGVRGHGPLENFWKIDAQRCILGHSQSHILDLALRDQHSNKPACL